MKRATLSFVDIGARVDDGGEDEDEEDGCASTNNILAHA